MNTRFRKIISFLMTIIVLSSCGGSKKENNSESSSASSSSSVVSTNSSTTNDNSTNHSSSIINKLDEVSRISPYTYKDEHVYLGKSYASFPTYNESSWNTSLKFTLSEDGTYYIVSDYLGADRKLNTSTLIIPAYYKGLPVEEIAQAAEGIGAFSELTWLKTVYLPHTIKRIGYGTFSLSALENLYIDCEELEDFDGRNWVFYPPLDKSYSGMNVYFGPNVKRIPERLFYPNVTEPKFVPKINNIYFDKNCKLEFIGAHAFHDVTYFDSLCLPDTVKVIEEYAFYKASIKELVLPASLTRIDNDAFSFSKIENIKFNSELSYIGDRAFAYSKLRGIDLSSTKIEVINDEAFAYVSSLRGIKFPANIKEIGERAFLATGLINLSIPDSVTLVRNEAFSNCTSLERLYLGTNLKIIKEKAFYNASSLISLEVASVKLDDFAFANNIFTKAGLNKGFQVYFLDGVTYIPNNMFLSTSNIDDLPNIAVLSIANSIIEIGTFAFEGQEISRVNYRGNQQQFANVNTNGNVFDNLDLGGIIYA